jgi:hypothetical protein
LKKLPFLIDGQLEKSQVVGDSDDNEPEFHEEDLGTLPPSTSEAEINQSLHTNEPYDC